MELFRGSGIGGGRILKVGNESSAVIVAKEGGSRNKGVSTMTLAAGCGLPINPSIDLNPESAGIARSPIAEDLTFFEAILAEGLSPKAGLNRHDKDQVDSREVWPEGVHRGVRIEDETGLAVISVDLLEGRAHLVAVSFGLDMDADEVGAGIGKGFDE